MMTDETPNERVVLTRVNADALLKPGEYVHTFMQAGGFVLIGCDWKREDILTFADQGRLELAGETATKMKHGIVAMTKDGLVFCETIEPTAPTAP